MPSPRTCASLLLLAVLSLSTLGCPSEEAERLTRISEASPKAQELVSPTPATSPIPTIKPTPIRPPTPTPFTPKPPEAPGGPTVALSPSPSPDPAERDPYEDVGDW